MTYRPRCFCAAILAGALAAGSASAQVLFQDNFDSHPNGDTASVLEGGTPNDGDGDADPVAAIGTWGPIFESAPWKVQVSTATNSTAPGPAPGSTKYLSIVRPGNSEARGTLASAATGLLSVDYQMQVESGRGQFFVRDATGGGFSLLPAFIDLTPSGTVTMNGMPTSLTFDPTQYASVRVLLDVPSQTWSASVNGMSAANATDRPFLESITSIQQISFAASDDGNFGVDNVLIQVVPEPGAALLSVLACAGLIFRRIRCREAR